MIYSGDEFIFAGVEIIFYGDKKIWSLMEKSFKGIREFFRMKGFEEIVSFSGIHKFKFNNKSNSWGN